MSNNIAIILCAGKGTRMNDESTNKVCFEVAGVPVIRRAVSAFRRAGVDNFVVVVGYKAEKVMECLAGERNIAYAFQSKQQGTGSATLCGLSVARGLGYTGDVIVSAGDKIIDSQLIADLIEKKSRYGLDMVFGAQIREFNPNGGRVVVEKSKIMGIVESTDSALMALGVTKSDQYMKVLSRFNLGEKKNTKILKAALEMDSIPSSIDLCGEQFTSERIEKTNYINGSLYCFNICAAEEAINSIQQNNAQGEFYLTDMVNYFVRNHKVDILPITRFEQMMTYSTKEELHELNEYFIFKDLKTPSCILSDVSTLNKSLQTVYGVRAPKKTAEFISILKSFVERNGNEGVIITRAPGRVNLMGRHVEHRGGCTNMMCTENETILIVSPRHDDIVSISNMDDEFHSYSFSISKCMQGKRDYSSWIEFIESPSVQTDVYENKGAWVNYVKAAVMRFRYEFPSIRFVGMNILMKGDIPIAAGLSSSSSIVVATAEAIVTLNHINVSTQQFVDLCGEGEWLVGTRGGSGDHAAMKCSSMGKVTHMFFKPFSVGESIRFSSDYKIVVADSCIQAKKSEGSKDKFNQKVACYEFGLMLIRKFYPQYAEKLHYLRDLNRIGLTDIQLYEMLLTLPERATTTDLYELLPERIDEIKHLQKSHAIPAFYEVRSVMLFGISECLRSEKACEIIAGGDYQRLGEMMNISHNGDRVWKNGKPYDYSASDIYLKSLIKNLKSGMSIEESRIINQGGGYACSTPQIDGLVDLACSCSGVLGAQIAGAGLGGSVIILVESGSAESLISVLNEQYYKANGFKCSAQICSPSAGSSVIIP